MEANLESRPRSFFLSGCLASPFEIGGESRSPSGSSETGKKEACCG